MKKLKIVFCKDNKKQEILYNVVSNPVSERWIKKIKHLSKIKHSPIETTNESFSQDIADTHRKFCEFAGIDYKIIDYDEQESLNFLHELYVSNHDRLGKIKNNDIVYSFHNAIHELEDQKIGTYFFVGWGIKEGPLTEKVMCNEFYEKNILKNNIYLPWSELGKTPMIYYRDKEISNIDRLCELAKPHTTLRAKFTIALKNFTMVDFPSGFKEWFDPFKQAWLDHYKIKDWRIQDEYAGVLLAEPKDQTMDIEQVLKEYPTFHSLEIV
jgi:hypothetical protein